MIRASDLQGKRVRRENGDVLGRVYEIRLHHSRVAALICGAGGFLQRLGGRMTGHRVPWEQVRKITASEIIIADKGTRKVRRAR
ncbi:MAG TPA: PRC-barrel domain-containing protein [Rhizomicrobium sp.]